jgi:hypothetical protein
MRLEEKRVGKTTVTESNENVNPIRAAGPRAQAMKPATAGLCLDHGQPFHNPGKVRFADDTTTVAWP